MVVVKKKKSAVAKEDPDWPFGLRNYLVFILALVIIIIGYISLGYGSITLAPVLLIAGYCVLIPIAIMIKGRPDEADTVRDEDAASSG